MTYQSPFTIRYGSDSMRALWSETAKRRAWRRVWVAVAEAQAAADLISAEQIDEIRAHALDIDLKRAAEIESEIGHDLMAELKTFAEQCPLGGGVLHWGLTSADVQDNADILRQKAALAVLLGPLRDLLLQFAELIEATADLVIMGYTHLQPAEPTTFGYRLSGYAQDLLAHFDALVRLRLNLRGKGIRGAVGTEAPFVDMLADSPITPEMLEATVMDTLDIEAYPITTQTYPRLQDYTLLCQLAGLAATLHKFAFDLRLMQSPGFRTSAEPFGERQVGSSAMPFKRNPVKAEKICSLARQVAASVSIAWHNSATNLLERTLDDSANRRSLIPETFLACDEMLRTALDIVTGLDVDEVGIEDQLTRFGPFAALERILTTLVRAGADRQEMHERLREHSMVAWDMIQNDKPNPLPDRLAADTTILQYLQPARIRALLDARSYVGTAPQRARDLAARIHKRLGPTEKTDE
ncbi:MAG TPA: adenylosuccinate lyase [Anaerolineae bacterium]|nr:adenylosuccinate lyase [Anaerolineae bacterium]